MEIYPRSEKTRFTFEQFFIGNALEVWNARTERRPGSYESTLRRRRSDSRTKMERYCTADMAHDM